MMHSAFESSDVTSSIASILLVGAGGHAISCIDVIERAGGYRIAGLVGAQSEVGSVVSGYTVLMSDEGLPAGRNLAQAALVVVGQIKSADLRKRFYDRLVTLGYSLPVVISPSAITSERARLGDGTIVMHGAIVNAGAELGENCIVNSRALIEHGVRIGAHCHVATGAIVNGDVRIGQGSFVGSGTVIRQGVQVGTNCIIGMGSIITWDVPDGAMVRRERTI